MDHFQPRNSHPYAITLVFEGTLLVIVGSDLYMQSSADEDSDRSLQDLTSLTHSGDLSFSKKKLSARFDSDNAPF